MFDKTELMQRWAVLSTRERLLASLGLIAILVATLYALVYAPLQAENKRLQQQIQAQQDIHKHLQAVAQRVKALREQGVVQSDVAIEPAQAIAESSSQLGLAAAIQIQPDSEGAMVVKVTQLGFDKLVYWLAVLQQQHGLSVAALDVHRTAHDVARVDGALTLRGNN